MLLASRSTTINQFTFHLIDQTAADIAILFIFLEELRNFKCRRTISMNGYDIILMAAEPEAIIKAIRRDNQFATDAFAKWCYC